MTRLFAYCPVSSNSQTTDNLIQGIVNAAFAVQPNRVVAETTSGSVVAMERKGFVKLTDKLESGDVMVVTKMDRLGRNSMDVRATVERLAGTGCAFTA